MGAFMNERREGLGLSLRDASKLSGVSHTHIRDIEEGRSGSGDEVSHGLWGSYIGVHAGDRITY